MLNAIAERRSIRRYKNKAVPRELLEKIVLAGTLAPSSKNRQPWRFIVTAGKAKAEALEAMRKGLEREESAPLLPDSAHYLPGARHTLDIMEQAYAVIFALDPMGSDIREPLSAEGRVYEICNAQSLGAAMENMSLQAAELGLGSLWICDTYFAYSELNEFFGGEIRAALAVGYADEAPPARPRKPFEEAIEWRE